MKAHEPTFAMFRLRPVVEYVPALPRPDEEREANNRIFPGMVAKHLMKSGGVHPAFVEDHAAHGKAVSALLTEVMAFFVCRSLYDTRLVDGGRISNRATAALAIARVRCHRGHHGEPS